MKKTIEDAVIFATQAHRGMKRKAKGRAYILHPLEVMVIVSALTEDEDVLAAAVLHDTVEDTSVTLEDITREFGERVSVLVAAESEDKHREVAAKDSWVSRKQETISHLQNASRETRLICLGDKLANLREMARDHKVLGDALWERFHQNDPAMHAWYYRSVFEILEKEFGDAAAIREYRSLLREVFGDK